LPGFRSCTAALPVNDITDQYDFYRLVPLVTDELGLAPIVIPHDVLFPGFAEIYARLNPSASMTMMKGGTPLLPEWQTVVASPAGDATATVARSVAVPDVDALLTSREFEIDGAPASVKLDAVSIRSLIARCALRPQRLG
jgi:hypothetical protein